MAARMIRSIAPAVRRANNPATSPSAPTGPSPGCGAACGVDRDAAPGSALPRSSMGARACMLRGLMTSGVARRTASGGRGGDAFVMSGSSSALGAPNSGRSAAGRDSGPPITRSRSGAAPRDGQQLRRRHRGIEQRQIVKRIDVPRTRLADGQLGKIDRGEQREVISTIAASFDRLEPEIAALGTLHGRRGGPFAGATAGGRSAGRSV